MSERASNLTVRFIGIDLGWMGRPSGYAQLEWDGKCLTLVNLTRLNTHADVLAAIPAAHPAWIGVDAPVIITNSSGSREADRTAHELFSRQHAGCYPVNLGLPFAPGVLKLISEIQALGFSPELPVCRKATVSHIFEVYPHAASVRLFNLERILPYKKGKVLSRHTALSEFRHLILSRLPLRQPALQMKSLPETGSTLAELKSCEDQLDAVLCAYIAAHFWYWGAARTNILGDPANGFIVNPSF